jgi:hypothetical protein
MELPPQISPQIRDIAVRLADEGVPLHAIARATRIAFPALLSTLTAAIEAGALVDLPPNDWPPHDARHARSRAGDREQQALALRAALGATRAETRILLTLMRSGVISTQHLSPSPIPVQIHRLRRHLAPHNIRILSVWGYGYRLPSEDRDRLVEMISRTC